MTVTLSKAEARRRLVAHLGLARILGKGAAGTRAVLDRLRCIQLDPLDAIGTNADLVVMARTEGVRRGDVWRHLFPKHAFEHFAKERCILPAEAFGWYQQQGHAAQTHWWRHEEREQRVAPKLIAAVLDEIRERGPITSAELTDHGRVEPLDWAGWKSTDKATTMALEILWTRCDVVVAGRTESGAKLYDVPKFAVTPVAGKDFPRWALRERAHAAGLLSRAGGAMWSMLNPIRTSPLVDEMIEAGELIDVQLEDSPRRYLAVPELLKTRAPRYDDRVRILGPLDPLLWDRNLVRHVFGFEYVWEVYKPARQRIWGWYVCPLLHRDRLIGRIDAKVDGRALVVKKIWLDEEIDVAEALARHAGLCGVTRVKMPTRSSRR